MVVEPGVAELECLLLPIADSLGLLFTVEKNNRNACKARGRCVGECRFGSMLPAGPHVHLNGRSKRGYHTDHTGNATWLHLSLSKDR